MLLLSPGCLSRNRTDIMLCIYLPMFLSNYKTFTIQKYLENFVKIRNKNFIRLSYVGIAQALGNKLVN